jgi:hypothetical protein
VLAIYLSITSMVINAATVVALIRNSRTHARIEAAEQHPA